MTHSHSHTVGLTRTSRHPITIR